MILAVDVQYKYDRGAVAGIEFDDWQARVPVNVYTTPMSDVAAYESGNFYKRELPCILSLLNNHSLFPDTIVIDGYVYLDGHTQPGMGKYLFDALHENATIIGVAKNPYSGISEEYALFRGISKKPLYITCAGSSTLAAKDKIKSMYGDFRIPKLLKEADRICRAMLLGKA